MSKWKWTGFTDKELYGLFHGLDFAKGDDMLDDDGNAVRLEAWDEIVRREKEEKMKKNKRITKGRHSIGIAREVMAWECKFCGKIYKSRAACIHHVVNFHTTADYDKLYGTGEVTLD